MNGINEGAWFGRMKPIACARRSKKYRRVVPYLLDPRNGRTCFPSCRAFFPVTGCGVHIEPMQPHLCPAADSDTRRCQKNTS